MSRPSWTSSSGSGSACWTTSSLCARSSPRRAGGAEAEPGEARGARRGAPGAPGPADESEDEPAPPEPKSFTEKEIELLSSVLEDIVARPDEDADPLRGAWDSTPAEDD